MHIINQYILADSSMYTYREGGTRRSRFLISTRGKDEQQKVTFGHHIFKQIGDFIY